MKHYLLPCLLLGAACTSTKVSALRLGDKTYPARDSEYPIAVYETADDVPRPFVKIGTISANRYDNTWVAGMPLISQIGEVIEPMKRKAREIGADALVLKGNFEVNTTSESKTTATSSKTAGKTSSSKTTERTSSGANLGDFWGHKAAAIRFTDEPEKK